MAKKEKKGGGGKKLLLLLMLLSAAAAAAGGIAQFQPTLFHQIPIPQVEELLYDNLIGDDKFQTRLAVGGGGKASLSRRQRKTTMCRALRPRRSRRWMKAHALYANVTGKQATKCASCLVNTSSTQNVSTSGSSSIGPVAPSVRRMCVRTGRMRKKRCGTQ